MGVRLERLLPLAVAIELFADLFPHLSRDELHERLMIERLARTPTIIARGERPSTKRRITVRVEGRGFVGAIICVGDVCTDATPSLRWALGQSRDDLRGRFAAKGWRAEITS